MSNAINAQGSLIRRASSISVASTSTNGLSLATGATDKISCGNATYSFIAQGFTSGMRVTLNSVKNTDVYTVKSVAATVMELYEDLSTSESGTALQVTGYTMSALGNIVSWTGPQDKVAIIDVTDLQSTAKEKMIAIKDSGQVSCEFFFNSESTQQQRLRDDQNLRTLKNFDIMMNDSASLNSYVWFPAFVNQFSISGGVDSPIKGSLVLEISGGAIYTTRR